MESKHRTKKPSDSTGIGHSTSIGGGPTESTEMTERELSMSEAEVEEVLELLSDEYTHRILEALSVEPLAARELVDQYDMCRATVYRRLNKLQEHDLVSSHLEFHPEGHHRKVFEVTLEEVMFEIDDTPTLKLKVQDTVEEDDPVSIPN